MTRTPVPNGRLNRKSGHTVFRYPLTRVLWSAELGCQLHGETQPGRLVRRRRHQPRALPEPQSADYEEVKLSKLEALTALEDDAKDQRIVLDEALAIMGNMPALWSGLDDKGKEAWVQVVGGQNPIRVQAARA